MLEIYNSLARKKEPFTPIVPGKAGIYVCGMTVYDLCHIGHARVMVVFDLVTRYLRNRGYEVTYVRNITDIDDKIIARAIENNESIQDLTGRFIDAMHEDIDRLGVLRPDLEPRATEHMDEILALIEKLIENGYAYKTKTGDICFRVRKFEQYGRLSGKSLDDLQVGARVEAEAGKDDPLDFVLWKQAKSGEPSWQSDWGDGRPGWHIECSAMSMSALGENFDIHGGGQDLRFPHHENEIAQSECATGHPFVNLWMHNGFVRIDDEKMSKSLGNFFTIRDVLNTYHPEILRYFIINSHYRSPLNYSDDTLDQSKAALEGYYLALDGIEVAGDIELDDDIAAPFIAAMDDDFNTPEALSVLSALRRDINTARQSGDNDRAQFLAGQLKSLGAILGLFQLEPIEFLRGISGRSDGAGLSDSEVDALVEERTRARDEKNWARGDEIRDELNQAGIVLDDSANGTRWRRE
jgi:cysteinyl-tRNA synthetase